MVAACTDIGDFSDLIACNKIGRGDVVGGGDGVSRRGPTLTGGDLLAFAV